MNSRKRANPCLTVSSIHHGEIKMKNYLLAMFMTATAFFTPLASANVYSNPNVEAAVTSATTMISTDAMLAVGALGAAVMAVVILIKIFKWLGRAT